MVDGSRDRREVIPWRRATLTWMLIVFVETLHGIAREIFIAPVLGDLRSRQWGVLAGCVLILAIALLTTRWMGAGTRRAQLAVGGFWVLLTLAFELALGRALGEGWDRILADYNPARGGFMMPGMLFLFLTPMLAARLRP